MRLKSILGVGCLSAFLAAPAFAGVFIVDNPGAPTSTAFTVTIRNDDGFDLTKITFDLTNTSSSVGGPLVFGGVFGDSYIIGSGTATSFGNQDDLTFGWNFTGFNSGEAFQFSWDPDVAGNISYGAELLEAAGTALTLVTTGGTVTGTMTYNGGVEGGALSAIIDSPGGNQVPEPATLALLGLGLAGLGFSRRRKAA